MSATSPMRRSVRAKPKPCWPMMSPNEGTQPMPSAAPAPKTLRTQNRKSTMRKIWKLALLPIALCASACVSARPNISLGLTQITCPASLSVEAEDQGEFDGVVLALLPPWAQSYVLTREGRWENIRAAGEHAKADGLEACADFNRRAGEARND